MTVESLNITRTAKDGRDVHFLEYRGRGSLSERYIVEIDGNRYFMKTYLNTDLCSGAGSRNIIRNEIYTYSALPQQPMLYKGHIEIDDVRGLLFEDMMTATRDGKSLADCIFEANSAVPVSKDEVKATYFLPLEEAVHILAQVAEQVHTYHSAPGNVVHMDISPENILLINDFENQLKKRKALVSDFGLAREKESSSKYLLNQASVAGIASTYYGSDNGIFHNRIYSPPNVDKDYQNAEASYDTYNLANILCLMLTGRLAEYWKKDPGASPHSSRLREIITQQIFSHYTLETPTSNVRNIKSLVEIICKGTSDLKSERYQTAVELQKALLDLGIPVPVSYQPEPTLSLEIPPHFHQYRVSEPPLHEVYGPELEQMQKTLDDIVKESSPHFQTSAHLFGGSIDHHLLGIKERDKKNTRLRRKTFKYAALGVSLGAMLAGGIYLLGNFFPQFQFFPKTLWSTTSSTGVEAAAPIEPGAQSIETPEPAPR